jgi:hypothetical protein
MLSEAQRHEQEKEEHMRANDLAFMFEDWTPTQFAVAAKNMKRILKELQIIDSQMIMYDIVSNTSHLEIDWKEIAKGTCHEADETEMNMVSRWRESQITVLNN